LVGDQILIGLHDAAEKGLTELIEKIFDRTMDLEIDMRVRVALLPIETKLQLPSPDPLRLQLILFFCFFESCICSRDRCTLTSLSTSFSCFCQDRYERTPLHWAAESGHSQTCIVLIELGADAFAKEGMGRFEAAPLELIYIFDKRLL
jgi:hypothetical protein